MLSRAESAHRKLFQLAALWAVPKANTELLLSEITHNSSLIYGKCPVKLGPAGCSVRWSASTWHITFP